MAVLDRGCEKRMYTPNDRLGRPTRLQTYTYQQPTRKTQQVQALWKGVTPFSVHLFTKYALRFGTNAAFQVGRIVVVWVGGRVGCWLAGNPAAPKPITPPPTPPQKQSMLAGPDGQLDSKRRLLAGLGAGVTEAVRVCVFAACRASCHVCFLCLGASITRQPRSSQLLHPQTPHNKLPKNNRFLSSLPSMW